MKLNRIVTLCALMVAGICLGCGPLAKLFDKSGTEFKVQIEAPEGGDKTVLAMQAIRIIQTKLNVLKLKGEALTDPDDPTRFVVRIYGSQDLDRTKEFLFTSHQLEIRKVVSMPNPSPVQVYATEAAARSVAAAGQEVLSFSPQSDGKVVYAVVEKALIISGDDIRDAQAMSASRQPDDYQISFSLKPQAAATFGEWTGKNIGNYIAVVLDKKIQSCAYLKSQIFDSGEINGRFTKKEAEEVALSLKSGYLPASMKIISERRFER